MLFFCIVWCAYVRAVAIRGTRTARAFGSGREKNETREFFFFRDPARTVDVMAVGRACARADRAPASFTSAAMVCRSPGGSAAMVSAVHAVTPGVRPVTPPGCSMVSGAPTQRGTSLAPDAVVPSGFSTGRLVPPRGTRRPPQAARAMMPRVSASARTRATPPPPQSRAAPSARAPAGRMTRRTRSFWRNRSKRSAAFCEISGRSIVASERKTVTRSFVITSTLVATSLRVAP